MLNIEKYQTVAIGDSVNECEKNYRQLMVDSGIVDEAESEMKKESRQILEKTLAFHRNQNIICFKKDK